MYLKIEIILSETFLFQAKVSSLGYKLHEDRCICPIYCHIPMSRTVPGTYIIDTYKYWIILNALHFIVSIIFIIHISPLCIVSLHSKCFWQCEITKLNSKLKGGLSSREERLGLPPLSWLHQITNTDWAQLGRFTILLAHVESNEIKWNLSILSHMITLYSGLSAKRWNNNSFFHLEITLVLTIWTTQLAPSNCSLEFGMIFLGTLVSSSQTEYKLPEGKT